jgi:curved DNA-binding protein CbpA
MGNYQYFVPTPRTLEELKAQYRRLAMQHHPDQGGDLEAMKAVNHEYDLLFPRLKDVHQNKDGETYTAKQATSETADQFKDLISELMKMDNIIIEVIGCFVWVTGDTKPHKERLKELRFQWHKKKTAWYLKPEDYRKRSQKDYDLDEIRDMYGTSGEVKSSGTTKISASGKENRV